MSQVPVRFQCRHVHAAGHRCGSPALRGKSFCFFHRTSHQAESPVIGPQLRPPALILPALEDRTSILVAIGKVVQQIAHGSLENKQAGLLLYALQIAAQVLPPPGPAAQSETLIEDFDTDPDGTCLAPESELLEVAKPLGFAEVLLSQFAQYQAELAQEAPETCVAQQPLR